MKELPIQPEVAITLDHCQVHPGFRTLKQLTAVPIDIHPHTCIPLVASRPLGQMTKAIRRWVSAVRAKLLCTIGQETTGAAAIVGTSCA